MYTITKSLPVCLDQILHFDVYKITLDHILSLEPSSAEFLKTRAGIKNWLNRFETFDTFRFWTKRNAREMLRIIDDTPVTYMDWVTYVANSESVISHISVGRCVIPCAFFGKSVKHTFSCRRMYPV